MYGLPLKVAYRAELFAPLREALSSRVGALEAERAAPALRRLQALLADLF